MWPKINVQLEYNSENESIVKWSGVGGGMAGVSGGGGEGGQGWKKVQ